MIHSHGQLHSMGRSRKAFTLPSITSHSRQTLLFDRPLVPMSLDQVVDRARRDALDISLLDHHRQCLLGHATRLEEAREAAPLPERRDAQLDGAGQRLPVPVAVAVALGCAK